MALPAVAAARCDVLAAHDILKEPPRDGFGLAPDDCLLHYGTPSANGD